MTSHYKYWVGGEISILIPDYMLTLYNSNTGSRDPETTPQFWTSEETVVHNQASCLGIFLNLTRFSPDNAPDAAEPTRPAAATEC